MKLSRTVQKYWFWLVILAFCLTPLIWFWGKGKDILINGIDTNFPLNPLIWFVRRFFVWNDLPNAGIDFSASTAGLFFHLIQFIPYILGLSLQNVQIVSLVFWFAAIVFGAWWLARSIVPKNKIAQLLFVSFYSFNTYIFNTWENVKVANLALVAGLPPMIALLINLNSRKLSLRRSIFFSTLIGLVISGTGINPAYFASLFLGIILYFVCDLIASRRERVKKIKHFLAVTLIVVLVNLFWILPTSYFIAKTIPVSESIKDIGFNNWINSLSENTSIFNVMRLQGAWDWYSLDSVTKLPLYIPYALNYFYRFPFILFSLILPSLSLLSLAIRDKRKNNLYLAFSVMTILGIFLGAGTHPPTGYLFSFFLDRLPFFSLFRSPWYIFTPILIMGYAGLTALLFNRLAELLSQRKPRFLKLMLSSLGASIIAANLVYCYPLVTGKIFRPGRSDGFFIKFPEHVTTASEWLANEKTNGRILSYPDDEIESFSWGYRGIESILQLLSDKEVVFSSLNAPDTSLSRMIKSTYLNLKKGQVESFLSLASRLNLAYIFEKGDQPSLSPPLPDKIKGRFEAEKTGPWKFYKLPREEVLPKIFLSRGLSHYYPTNKGEIALSVLDKSSGLIAPDDSVVKEFGRDLLIFGKVIVADNIQAKDFSDFSNSPSQLANRLITRSVSRALFEFDIPEDGFYQPALERYKIEDFGIDLSKPMSAESDGQEKELTVSRVSDSYIFFGFGQFKKGRHTLSFNLANRNLVTGGDFESGDTFEKGGYGEGSVVYEIEKDGSGNYLVLFNLDRAEQSANFAINDFEPLIPYYIEVRYRQIYGNNALVVADQSIPSTLVKAQSERLPNYPEWRKFSFYYQPVETDSKMRVSLVAPHTKDVLGTKILYDDLSVRKVFTNNLILIKKTEDLLVSPEVQFQKVSPVLYKGEVNKATDAHVLTFLENYSSGWSLELYDETGLKLKINPPHFTVNLYANGWYLGETPENYSFRLYYKPQKIFNLGLVVTTVVMIGGLYVFLSKNKKN